MIKSDSQLKNQWLRKKELEQEIRNTYDQYEGIEAKILAAGFEIELNVLNEEIREYGLLKTLTLQEAINGPLRRTLLLDHVSELLSKLRIAAGLSQSELAKELGWKQSNISRFESENYSSQTLSKIIEYASVLGVWLHVVPALTDEPAAIEFPPSEEIVFSQLFATAISKQGNIDKPVESDSDTHSGDKLYISQTSEVVA